MSSDTLFTAHIYRETLERSSKQEGVYVTSLSCMHMIWLIIWRHLRESDMDKHDTIWLSHLVYELNSILYWSI